MCMRQESERDEFSWSKGVCHYTTTFDWICVSKRVVLQQLSSVQIRYKGPLKSSQGSEQLWALIKLNLRIFLLEVFAEVVLTDPKRKRGRSSRGPGHVISQSERLHDSKLLSTAPTAGTSAEKHVPQCFVNKESGTQNWERYATWSAWLRILFCCLMWIRDWWLVIVHQPPRIHVNILENWCLQISFHEWSLLHYCFLSRFCTLPWEIHSIDQVDWD